MARDAAGGARALGVDCPLELRAFLEGEVLGDYICFDRRGGADVDAIGGDVSLEVPVDRDCACRHRGVDPRSGGGHETVALEVDGALEEPIDHHIFTCDQFSLDDECRSAAHAFYFHSSLSFRQAERKRR